MSKPPLRPRRPHPAPLAALAVVGLAGPAAALTAPPERAALQARIDAVRTALAATPAASSAAAGWPLAQANNWTNWPKWSKWSNWANK